MKDEIVDYIEDLPTIKQYQATFCITLKVEGIDEADATQEAWEKFQAMLIESIGTDETWFDSFEINVHETEIQNPILY